MTSIEKGALSNKQNVDILIQDSPDSRIVTAPYEAPQQVTDAELLIALGAVSALLSESRKQEFLAAQDEQGRIQFDKLSPELIAVAIGYVGMHREDRMQSQVEIEGHKEVLPRTRETAWTLGALSLGANVFIQDQTIRFYGKQKQFRGSDKTVNQIASVLQTEVAHLPKKQYSQLILNPSPEIISSVGNLNAESWPDLLTTTHSWALQNEEFRWGLIEGLFDVKGRADNTARRARITFSLKSKKGIDLLLEILRQNGVQNAGISSHINKSNGGVRYLGIFCTDASDRYHIASNIKSLVDEKEKFLAEFRQKEPQSRTIKREQLLAYVQSEVESFQGGNFGRLSTVEELANQFGFTPNTVVSILYEHSELGYLRSQLQRGINRPRATSIDTLEKQVSHEIPQSADLAWLMGSLALDGSVNQDYISLRSKNLELVERFRAVGEGVFGLNASVYSYQDRSDAKESRQVVFSSRKTAAYIGDYRRDHWPRTIVEQHPWIVERPEALAAFVGGIFDTRGFISPNSNRVHITAGSAEEAEFLVLALNKMGIEEVRVGSDYRVSISSKLNVKRLADSISSTVQEKEERLQAARGITTTKYHESNRPANIEEVIQEGLSLIEAYGVFPSSRFIEQLRKDKHTKFAPAVYRRWLGEGDFYKAREVLERMHNEKLARMN